MQTVTHINPSLTELGKKFTQLEPDSVTAEEGDLLYALVRMRKPSLAIETGTGHAIATKRIGEALRDNGEGLLISCDTEPEYAEAALKAVQGLPVDIRCSTGVQTILACERAEAPDFILVDAGDALNRLKELRLIIENHILSPRGILVVHDALNPNYRQLIEYMEYQAWPSLILESLAGIAVFQKPRWVDMNYSPRCA